MKPNHMRIRTGSLIRSLINGFMTGYLLFNGLLATGQVGVNTDTPDNSSALEIQSTTRGLLIPRVALTANLTSPSPVTSPATGLLVFNSGANQPVGFYYWDGVMWVQLGSGGSSGSDYWSLYGNSGTALGSNFLGTTDDVPLSIYTNNTERMRFNTNGQSLIGSFTPNNANDVLEVFGNTTRVYAIGAFSTGTGSNGVGFYTASSGYGFSNNGGKRGVNSLVNSSTAGDCAIYSKNQNTSGYGILTAGSNQNVQVLGGRSAGISSTGTDGMICSGLGTTNWGVITSGSGKTPTTLTGRSGGLAAVGFDGVFAWGKGTTGRGIIAGGDSTVTYSMSNECEGGALTGYHGVFARGRNASGIGVIGLGSGGASYSLISGGCGGWFAGGQGIFGRATDAAGIGVVGMGNNGSTYPSGVGGSGGSFSGNHGLISSATNASAGIGVIGIGNNSGYALYASGAGGAFYGTVAGAVGYGTNASGSTGVIGTGNNIAPVTYTGGSGGAFIGNSGVYAVGGTASGTGVIGVGNNTTLSTATAGSGGAFTGTVWGVYGYATNSSSTRGGGYFACNPTSGGAYAYCGYRNGTTNYKTIGNGTNSTIVKNTNGDLITLFCPEAPEVLFQDYGIGQLVNGRAHITIDPDLAKNINVSEDHPLKVYITPEGECNGVYVANKSQNGFDVIELMGGKSNVPFAWQIVATRADEETLLSDGSVSRTTYHDRFPPAPGPLETAVDKTQTGQGSSGTESTPSPRNQLMPVNSLILKDIKAKEVTVENAEVIQIKDAE